MPSEQETREPEILSKEERWLRCAICIARVVPEAGRIVVNGAHVHEFMNPAGIRFTLGCWASAPGCLSDGEREAVWTWFPGHAWQVEACRCCGAHLGWSFHRTSDGSSFYGLILARLL